MILFSLDQLMPESRLENYFGHNVILIRINTIPFYALTFYLLTISKI